MNPFVEAIGMLGGGLGFLISIPQLVRVVKHKSQMGVSLGTWLFILVSCVGWTTYGWRFFSISQIVTNTIASVLAITLSYVLMRERFTLGMRLLVLTAIAGSTIFVVGYAPVWLMDVWLYAALWSRMPQMWKSYQSWRERRSSVVSMTTYWLSIVSSIAWVFYGVLADRPEVTWFSAIVATQSLLIVVFEWLAQRAVADATLRTP